jgi:very-short-patch-repair endonuclease
LRTTSTDAEKRLWSRLRNRQLGGVKFVRQFPIGPYFADFTCREAMLIVELDGGQHAESAHDVRRTAYLDAQGYRVQRFWNNDVLKNTDGVLAAIAAALAAADELPLTPTLSPEGRGGEHPNAYDQE